MSSGNTVQAIKICVLGEVGAGKSSLTLQFTQNHFPVDFDPTVEDTYIKDVEISNKKYQLNILDTANEEEYSPLKDHQLEQADGFIIVFNVNSIDSLRMVSNYYRHIMRVRGSLPPCILIGSQIDQIDQRQVDFSEAEKLTIELTIDKYFEVSAKLNQNITEAFTHLVELIIEKEKEPENEQPPKAEESDNRSGLTPVVELGGAAAEQREESKSQVKGGPQERNTKASQTENTNSSNTREITQTRAVQSKPQSPSKLDTNSKCCIIM